MLNQHEEAAGILVKYRFRKALAEKVNNDMITRGTFWYDNFITKSPVLGFLAVFIPGLKFGSGVNDYQIMANDNYRSLLRELTPLDEHEVSFFNSFINSNFYACHATNSDAVMNENNDLVLFSRQRLINKKIIFPKENTTIDDIDGLGNDDNVFFSLEIGAPPQKNPLQSKGSRFGSTVYKIPFTNSAFETSSLILFDQLEMSLPKKSINKISAESNAILNSREYTRRNICFYGRKSIPALALSIIAATRLLDENDRLILLKMRTEAEFNRIMRSLFRIEIRVPAMVGVKFSEYYKFKFGQ